MLRVLLAKDLRRAWRNPLPWIINLVVPLAMTALIGLVFGGSNDDTLGRIRFAVVDEDKSVLADALRGSANQRDGAKYLDPVFLDREEALRLVNANEISAVLIVPTNFMRNYLTASERVNLELIKNPAESIHPAVLEELLGALVTGLNAVSRNFNSEFPEWRQALEGDIDYREIARLIERTGDKFKAAKSFLNPPLVGYQKDGDKASTTTAGSNGKAEKSKTPKNAPIFSYMLLGLAGMFLLFLGSNAMTDLHRELRKRTFERFQTLHQQVWVFIVSKIVFAVVTLVLCSAILLGGGGLIFGISWHQPLALIALILGYNCFVAALFAVSVALVPDERRAGVLNNIAGMALGLAGGCAFPTRQLPAFVREHLTPLLPSNWFVETARDLQFGGAEVAWQVTTLKLGVTALILVGLAGLLFRHKFRTGLRV